MATLRECRLCRFFDKGNCRRYPPRIVPYPNDNQHPVLYLPSEWWPSVIRDGCCGD